MSERPEVDYVARRARVMQEIGEDSALILFSNPEQPRSNDTLYAYRQSSDILYLCGFEEPEAVLVLLPGAAESFVLFVRPRDRDKEVWTGYRAGPDGAREDYGADAAFTLDTLEQMMPTLLAGRCTLYHALNASASADRRVLGWVDGLRTDRAYGDRSPDRIADPRKLIHRMRMVKDAGEIARMRIAAEISAQAHLHIMRTARPGQMEYELEAELTAHFVRHGAQGHAYDPIVAGGARACVLHYLENNRRLQDGDLVLVDAGAEWGHYAGDITRTWPIGARFDGEQRAVYDAVLDAQIFALSLSVEGTTNRAVHAKTVQRLSQNMIDIGLLELSLDEILETERWREFYMHGTGHYLGMDVHDVGPYLERDHREVVYQPGMVVTVEPGLYVRADSDAPERFHGIGVRIEDDIVIGAPDALETAIMTAAVPKEPAAIEALRKEALSGRSA